MPRYVYECKEHGEFEVDHHMDEVVGVCYCGFPVVRVIQAVGFVTNGDGFYGKGR
jgi:putative FmdB family regulatory protein